MQNGSAAAACAPWMLQIHGNKEDMDCLKLAVLACKALP
jgi:hypothetical protein